MKDIIIGVIIRSLLFTMLFLLLSVGFTIFTLIGE